MEMDTKNKNKTCFQNSSAYFAEFCDNTSIQGFKFLGEKRRSLFERIFWLIFMLISLYFCVTLTLDAYDRWQTSPVVVSFATSETPVWKIPFPAITICPQIKTYKKALNFTNLFLKRKSVQNLTELEAKQFKFMSLVCMDDWHLSENVTREDAQYDGEEIEDLLMQMQPNVSSIITECYWLGINCTSLINSAFLPILTNEGICFTFNQFDRDDLFTEDVSYKFYNKFSIPHQPSPEWSIDGGYKDDTKFLTYPRRTAFGGAHGGLDLTLEFNSHDMDYLCGESLEGFKFILHNPVQFPFVRQNYFRVDVNKDTTVAVKPTIMTTSPELKNYSPKQRQCYYHNEKKLRFFKQYDQVNCMQECLSNFTYGLCDCVSFAMIKDKSMPICGPVKRECMKTARSEFLSQHINLNYKAKKFLNEDCACLPSCSSLSFETEVTQSEWNWREPARILLNSDQTLPPKSISLSRVQVFYNSMQFITSERNELFGVMEFLSSCGGLLGLFTGFSVLSIVEIAYYLSLRIFCNYRIFGRQNWAGRSDL